MVTLTELLALDDGVLLDRVCAFTADERATLHRPALHAWERYSWRDELDGRKDRYTPAEGRRLDLIVFAAAPADRLYWPPGDDQLRVARSRGGRFVTALARHVLHTMATEDFGAPDFNEIRRAERDGLVTLDADDDYVLAMVNQLGGRFSAGGRRSDLLRADPDLLARAFWRIFEVEGNRQVSLANVDKYSGATVQSWHDAVLDLLSDATIDRARVLDATVAALGLGFPQYRAGWYSRLHAALAPSVDERATRQAGYAALLRSSVGPTVTLAVDALTGVEKAGRLDHDGNAAALAAGLAAAVLAPAKSTAMKALALAARAGAGQSSAVVAAALGHPHADVQAAAAEQLRVRGEPGPVLAALPSLAPAVATAARRWLGDDAPPVVAAPVPRPDRTAPVPVPDAVAPITDPAELAEAFAVLLADPTDAELLERALCAAARLGPDPVEYASLARRAARLLRDGPSWESDHLLDVVAGVVLAAAHTPPVRWLPPLAPQLQLLAGRAAAVESALRAGRRYAPCAEPTHAGGWIAPAVLVQRLSTGAPPDPLDAVAALLRLGPAAASADPAIRAAAAAVPGAVGAALRYALGGPPPATPTHADRPLWIAAARSRAPRGDDPSLIGLGPGYDAAGAGRAPTWRVSFDPERQYSRIRVTALGPAAPPAPTDPALPTVTLGAVNPSSDRQPGAPWHPWLASIWPGNIEPLLAIALPHQLASLDGTVDGGAGAHALRLLSQTVVELPPLSPYTVAAGLASARVSDRVAAVDAAVDLLPQRMSPEALASAMTTLAAVVPLNRWGASLADLATAGRGAQVRAVLTTLLPSLDRTTRGLYSLVELLRDEHLRAGTPVTAPGLQQWLAAATGTSRTAAAARSLRTADPLDHSDPTRE
ncbi:DUF6493 family protein [Dactylosporangium siamense]|uniref:Secreted protein n=1 Tax=Dactylosporangium siamense TaxID=685454 RepID=A0A919U802_9ACTN|nr:DUF6493 family protein [Dactylosporangium siamense]GIG45177.1 hypothetical protein Dsi01nite_032180 [Dactylosporangium siamense]